MSRKEHRTARIAATVEPPESKRDYHAVYGWLGETADEAIARYGADRIRKIDVVFILRESSVGHDGIERPGPRECAERGILGAPRVEA